MKNIKVITLGCSKNTVDSEHIMAQLAAAGYGISHDPESDADTVVINTCGFINDAKQQSIDTILYFAEAKKRGEIERLHVMGCLSERYRDDLRHEIPEVDSYFGARNMEEVVRGFGSRWEPRLRTERFLTTPSHYAYLKISEGCDRRCGFCAIPLIRGGHVSVPMEDLLDEARRLAARGVRELMVIAQDTTCYGMDIYGERRLAHLLGELCRVDGIEWIRLHYAYPAGFPDDVAAVMASEPRICKYLDIPLQHVSDRQLKNMRRGIGGRGTRDLIRLLRDRIPGIALRTTLLVGYPGETEEDFAELLDFVRETRFERLGVFTYSEEEGTYSAKKLRDDVPHAVKVRRADRVMSLQSRISLENNEKKIGLTMRAIVDSVEADHIVARSEHDSPEVDQEIIISLPDGLPHGGKSLDRIMPGCFVNVRITSALEYDLHAEIIGPRVDTCPPV